VAAATLALLEPEVGVFEWLEQAELRAMKRPLPKAKRPAGEFIVTEMLTLDEIAELRRKAKEASACYRHAFGNLRMACEKAS
jgi:hypothetical protein